MNKAVSIALVACLLAACGTTPEQKSGGEGAAIGGLGALLACKLAGGKDKACLAIGAAGAAAGGVVGYKYAENIQKRRQDLAGRENDLDARLDEARSLNHDTEVANQQLSQQVAARRRDIEQGRMSEAQLVAARRELDSDIKNARMTVDAGNSELEDLKRFRARQPARASGELDAQIAKLERSLAEAQRNTTALASLRQRI